MTRSDADVVVRLEKATRIYNPGETEVRAISDVDLDVRRGDYLALVGPSGSGKSTVLHTIGCLDRPDQGKVFVEGRDTSQLDANALSRVRNERVGFIFQSFNLLPGFTAYENIEFSLQILGGVSPSEMRDRVGEMLAVLGLEKQRDRRPNQLSGGQQQRVAIGRALVKRPAIILADEPTANLDRKTSEDIIGLMRRMNEEKQATFVFSTHDEHLMRHARRVVRLVDGRVVSDERTP